MNLKDRISKLLLMGNPSYARDDDDFSFDQKLAAYFMSVREEVKKVYQSVGNCRVEPFSYELTNSSPDLFSI